MTDKIAKATGVRADGLLDDMNPYVATLAQPRQVTGVRIPDLCTQPSATFTIMDQRTVTTSENGVATICYGIGAAAASKGSVIPSPTGYAFGCTAGGATTSNGDIFAEAIDFTITGWNGSTATIPNSYDAVRLVSAEVVFEFVGNSATSQGTVSGAFFPKSFLESRRSGVTITARDVAYAPDAVNVALNTLEPFSIKYRPVDEEVTRYSSTAITPQSVYVSGAGFPGCWVFFVQRAVVSTIAIRATFFGNYEAWPKSNLYSPLSAIPSIADLMAFSGGLNYAANMPLVEFGVTTTASGTAEIDGVEEGADLHATSGGGDIPGVSSRTKIVPALIAGGLGLAGSILPQLMGQKRGSMETLMDMLPTLFEKGPDAARAIAPLLMGLPGL